MAKKLTHFERQMQRMFSAYPDDEHVKRYLSGDRDDKLDYVLQEVLIKHPNNKSPFRLKMALSCEYMKRDREARLNSPPPAARSKT